MDKRIIGEKWMAKQGVVVVVDVLIVVLLAQLLFLSQALLAPCGLGRAWRSMIHTLVESFPQG